MKKNKPTIVLIDDKECSKMLLDSKVLTDKVNLIPAYTGKDGIKLIFKHKPDLIISDVVVPRGDIFFITDAVKKEPELKDIPIVAFSYLCSAIDEKEVRKSGVCDYIKKHECSPEKLTKKILDILKKKCK
jgi:response regulator RpfG family c-di-GMP phosphodiesterase